MKETIRESLQTIRAFVELVQNPDNRSAFSETAWQNLPQLWQKLAEISDTEPVAAAEAINIWLGEQRHEPLYEALEIGATKKDLVFIPPTDAEEEKTIKENMMLLKEAANNPPQAGDAST